ncbi:hypothetical protein JNJ66_02320 [Candidatus Saccharibacteria bacterium]|nr:hypothetical protein [Candidatus Saccharibacteria bacterium]
MNITPAPFEVILAEGGRSNSLGRVDEVVAVVLHDASRLEELYQCLFASDAWMRMRAADALEKICRVQPGWLEPYVDRIHEDLAASTQPSIQWHIAQIYGQVALTTEQRKAAISWLTARLSTTVVDWIVAANAMDTMATFVRAGWLPAADFMALVRVQLRHHSKSVVKRAERHSKEMGGATHPSARPAL